MTFIFLGGYLTSTHFWFIVITRKTRQGESYMKNIFLDPAYTQFIDGFKGATMFSLENLDNNLEVDPIFHSTTLKVLEAYCTVFYFENIFDLQKVLESNSIDWFQAGMDFYFTQAGDGVGFWDGDYDIDGDDTIANRLTENTKKLKTLEFYVGDDGFIYV